MEASQPPVFVLISNLNMLLITENGSFIDVFSLYFFAIYQHKVYDTYCFLSKPTPPCNSVLGYTIVLIFFIFVNSLLLLSIQCVRCVLWTSKEEVWSVCGT